MCKPNKEYRMREKEEDGFDYDCIKNGDLCVLPYCSCYQGYLLLVRISKDHFAADWRFFLFFFFFCMCMCMFQKERERYYLERKLNMWEVAVQCAQCKPKQKAYSDPFL